MDLTRSSRLLPHVTLTGQLGRQAVRSLLEAHPTAAANLVQVGRDIGQVGREEEMEVPMGVLRSLLTGLAGLANPWTSSRSS